MNDRPLPIVDTHSGLIIPGAAELIWGIMHYPNDTISAYSFHDLARGWLRTLESDAEATEPRVLRMILNDFSQRNGRAKVSALVLYTFIRIFKLNGSASLRKAYAHAADVMGKEPINGKNRGDAPSEERAIRRAYHEEFCSVAHFWLAHMITSHDENGLFDNSQGLNRFLGVAREIEEAATEAHLLIIDGRWIVPQSRPFDTNVRMRFHTGYDEEIETFCAGYSPNLENKLMQPFIIQTSNGTDLTANYMNDVLSYLGIHVKKYPRDFGQKLFKLLGNLHCPVNAQTVAIFDQIYPTRDLIEMSLLVSSFRVSKELDHFILQAYGPSLSKAFSGAMILASRGEVDPTAIEEVLKSCAKDADWELVLEFMSVLPFHCDRDQSERIASYLTRKEWPAFAVGQVLNSKTPTKVRNALYRQILAQGWEDRILELIKWLDGNRGAVGALSLENAFIHLKSFDLAINLAKEIIVRLGNNQKIVIGSSLRRLAKTSNDLDRLTAFERRYFA